MQYDQDYCFFFGTFNPVHQGHLIMAETARNQLKIKKVLFIPSYLPPHRQNEHDIASFAHRLKMLQLACKNHPAFDISSVESKRETLSYTVETLRRLIPDFDTCKNRFPFIIGSDALQQLGSWHEATVLAEKILFLQAFRPGFSKITDIIIKDQPVSINTQILEMPSVEISSTWLRERIAQGLSLKFLTPQPVIDYINWNRLYSSKQ